MLSFIDLSDAAMDTVEHLISVTNLEPSANYSVIELLVQALWRNSANAERLLRFLQKSILNDHTSSNLQKWMRLVLHRLRLTDAKKLPPGTKEFLETIQSLALRYLNSDDIDSIQTAIVLLYCQLTDDPSLIPHLERIVDSVDKKKQAALLILASIDRLSASRLQLACEQIGFNRFTKPLIDAIAESDQAASFWTLISDQFTIDGNSAEILCRLLQNNKKLVEAAQAMLPVFLDKVQRIPVAAIELPHIEFISQIVAIKVNLIRLIL
jgi:hypothetical protein